VKNTIEICGCNKHIVRKLQNFRTAQLPERLSMARPIIIWMYREAGNVVNKYISNKDNDIDDLIRQVQERQHLESLVRKLKKEQREMERYMKVSVNG
jgi:hypothetical protein